LPHGRGVGDVGYGYEGRGVGGGVAPEEDVEGGFGGEVGCEETCEFAGSVLSDQEGFWNSEGVFNVSELSRR
jgi:hypothetical protein